MFFCFIWCFPFFLVSFSSVSDGNIQKSCFNAETNDFDQRTACRSLVCWSKYTTSIKQKCTPRNNVCPQTRHVFLDDIMTQSELTISIAPSRVLIGGFRFFLPPASKNKKFQWFCFLAKSNGIKSSGQIFMRYIPFGLVWNGQHPSKLKEVNKCHQFL